MDPKTYERLLSEGELRLDRLRALYEQWFQGLERLEPTIPRKNFDRFMEQLRKDRPRVTGLKFRYHNLVTRYTTYIMYWRKVARQIEEGTYRRDILRARRQREAAREKYRLERERKQAEREGRVFEEPEPAAQQQPAAAASADAPAAPASSTSSSAAPAPPANSAPLPLPPADSAVTERMAALTERAAAAARASMIPENKEAASNNTAASLPTPSASVPIPPAGPPSISPFAVPSRAPPGSRGPDAAAARTAAPASAPAGLSDHHLRDIYDKYIAARKRNNESVDIKYEKLAGKMRAMLPELQKKHAGKQIDFEVVIRKGRVALKPVTR